jgi:hypothetical protein
MNLIPYKQWVMEEAERWGVKPGTIQNRVCKGQYPGLRRFFKNCKVIDTHPWPVAWISGMDGTPATYDFSAVDWSQRNCRIARALKCHPGTVRYARMKPGK